MPPPLFRLSLTLQRMTPFTQRLPVLISLFAAQMQRIDMVYFKINRHTPASLTSIFISQQYALPDLR
jgi:hypothetical protein